MLRRRLDIDLSKFSNGIWKITFFVMSFIEVLIVWKKCKWIIIQFKSKKKEITLSKSFCGLSCFKRFIKIKLGIQWLWVRFHYFIYWCFADYAFNIKRAFDDLSTWIKFWFKMNLAVSYFYILSFINKASENKYCNIFLFTVSALL